MKRVKYEPVGNVLRQFLREQGLETPLNQHRLIDSWPQVAGNAVARATNKLEIRDDTLFVWLKSPALKANLQMMRSALVKRLNEHVGAQVINNIRLI